MAHVEDRWVKDGQRTELYGKGKRYKARYIDPSGRERAKSFPDKQKKAAEDFLTEIESQKLHGGYLDPRAGKITFREYADKWQRESHCAPSTRENRERSLRKHAYPFLGNRPLVGITAGVIREWNSRMQQSGMAVAHVRTVFSHVSAVLSAAVEDERITKNPCTARTAKAPRPDLPQIVPWMLERVFAVRVELPERYRAKVDVGAGCGLRQGEICGLAVEDIDKEAGVIHVRRQVKIVGGKLVFGLPKMGKLRDVPLSRSVASSLATHMATYEPVPVTLPWEEPGGKPTTVRLVFTTSYRNAISRNMFMARIWHPALERAGVTMTRQDGLHALRHFYASVLLEDGVSIKALSLYLGHADPGFTLRVYTHLMPTSSPRARAAIDAAFARGLQTSDGLVTASADASQELGQVNEGSDTTTTSSATATSSSSCRGCGRTRGGSSRHPGSATPSTSTTSNATTT